MDEIEYQRKLEAETNAYEALCRRCGECCAAYGTDPCENLIRTKDGLYNCRVYADRLGPRKTVSGTIFTCVTMRDVHKHGLFYNKCPYNPK